MKINTFFFLNPFKQIMFEKWKVKERNICHTVAVKTPRSSPSIQKAPIHQ